MFSALFTKKSYAPRLVVSLSLLVSATLNAADPKSEQAFLDLLKSPTPSPRRFEAQNAPHWDIPKISAYLGQNGIAISKPKHLKGTKYSIPQITAALSARTGEVFRTFAHISFLLSHTRRQYSEIKIENRGPVSTVVVATFYEITFVRDSDSLKLVEIKDINSGD